VTREHGAIIDAEHHAQTIRKGHMTKRILRAAVLAAALAAVAAPAIPAAASPAPARVDNQTVRIGSCRSSGDFATCVASGSVNNPLYIRVHVKASPDQHVSGDWSMVCSKGSGAGSTQGTVSGTTPRAKRLRMPFANPDSCSVAADAQLSGGGSIHVYLTARIP
jgi:hypothetical protein